MKRLGVQRARDATEELLAIEVRCGRTIVHPTDEVRRYAIELLGNTAGETDHAAGAAPSMASEISRITFQRLKLIEAATDAVTADYIPADKKREQIDLTSKSDCWLVTSNTIALTAVRGHDRCVCSMFEQTAPENRSFSFSEAPMSTLTQARNELFRRRSDECFSSVESLIQHCGNEHRESQDRWHLSARLHNPLSSAESSRSLLAMTANSCSTTGASRKSAACLVSPRRPSIGSPHHRANSTVREPPERSQDNANSDDRAKHSLDSRSRVLAAVEQRIAGDGGGMRR